MVRCRVFGHRYRFSATGAVMRWECQRGCGAGGSKTSPRRPRHTITPRLLTARIATSSADALLYSACSRYASGTGFMSVPSNANHGRGACQASRRHDDGAPNLFHAAATGAERREADADT
jgi:hypothetical protein